MRLGLKEQLRGCFRHESGRRAYAPQAVVLLLVHVLVGCRELRDMARYRNDEAVRRTLAPRRVTVDFDGTVLPTRRLAEGSAVGCNPGGRASAATGRCSPPWRRPARRSTCCTGRAE